MASLPGFNADIAWTSIPAAGVDSDLRDHGRTREKR